MERGTVATAVRIGALSRSPGNAALFFALLLLGLICACLGNLAHAGEMHLLINGKAIHLDEQPGVHYNESNWGAGFQYDWQESERGWVPFVTASGFDDSNSNPSYYAGGGMLRRYSFYTGDTRLHADVGFVAFLMTRKDYKDGDPFPGLLPAFSVGTDRVAVNMTFIPKVDPKMVPILFFQLKIKLGDF